MNRDRGRGGDAARYLLPAALVAGLGILLWPTISQAMTPKTPPTPDPNKPDTNPNNNNNNNNTTPQRVAPDIAVPTYPAGTTIYRMRATRAGNIRGAPDVTSRIIHPYKVNEELESPNLNDLRAIGSDQAPQGWVPARVPGTNVQGWVALDRFADATVYTPALVGPGAFAAYPGQAVASPGYPASGYPATGGWPRPHYGHYGYRGY